MTEDEKLIKTLRARIASNPNLIPQVLGAVSDGMAAWERRVKIDLDSKADLAITAALNLPSDLKRLNSKNHFHRSLARVVAVGMGLVLRKPSNGVEHAIRDFVLESDQEDPESARTHYEIIKSAPIPPSG